MNTLYARGNTFTDTGITYFARALNLTSCSTLKTLKIGNNIVTNVGLVQLLEALSRQHSLEELSLWWSSPPDDKSLEKIGEYAKRSNLKELILLLDSSCKQFQTKEAKEWFQSVMVGGISLLSSLECCQVDYRV